MEGHDSAQCEGCIWHERFCKEVMVNYTGFAFDKQWDIGIKKWHDKCAMFKRDTSHRGNGKPQGIFAGTLTMSPTDPLNEEEMVTAIKKIMNQKTVEVKKYAWYVEYTDNGLPHIHFIYETTTGGRIHQKIFKRYWKIWDESTKCGRGHRGGYHKPVESETAYGEYIKKDGGRGQSNWPTGQD